MSSSGEAAPHARHEEFGRLIFCERVEPIFVLRIQVHWAPCWSPGPSAAGSARRATRFRDAASSADSRLSSTSSDLLASSRRPTASTSGSPARSSTSNVCASTPVRSVDRAAKETKYAPSGNRRPQLAGGLECEACLPDAAGASQRDDRRPFASRLAQSSSSRARPTNVRAGARQVSRSRRPGRWKLLLRARERRAGRSARGSSMSLRTCSPRSRSRSQRQGRTSRVRAGLAAVRRSADACRAREVDSDVVAAFGECRLAGVDADPGPGVEEPATRALCIGRGRDRVARSVRKL